MYCINKKKEFFRASEQHHFQKCKTLFAKHQLLLIFVIPQMRFLGFRKSAWREWSVLHLWKSLLGDALKTQLTNMQYTRYEMLDFLVFGYKFCWFWEPFQFFEAGLTASFPKRCGTNCCMIFNVCLCLFREVFWEESKHVCGKRVCSKT